MDHNAHGVCITPFSPIHTVGSHHHGNQHIKQCSNKLICEINRMHELKAHLPLNFLKEVTTLSLSPPKSTEKESPLYNTFR